MARGFSLVELMVAVGIISVLVALSIPRFGAFMTKARRGEAKVNLAQIATLQGIYKSIHSRNYYGAGMTGGNGLGNGGNCSDPADNSDMGLSNGLGFAPTDCAEMRYFYHLVQGSETAVAYAASDTDGKHIYPGCSGSGQIECGYGQGDVVTLALNTMETVVCRNITKYCPDGDDDGDNTLSLAPSPSPNPTPAPSTPAPSPSPAPAAPTPSPAPSTEQASADTPSSCQATASICCKDDTAIPITNCSSLGSRYKWDSDACSCYEEAPELTAGDPENCDQKALCEQQENAVWWDHIQKCKCTGGELRSIQLTSYHQTITHKPPVEWQFDQETCRGGCVEQECDAAYDGRWGDEVRQKCADSPETTLLCSFNEGREERICLCKNYKSETVHWDGNSSDQNWNCAPRCNPDHECCRIGDLRPTRWGYRYSERYNVWGQTSHQSTYGVASGRVDEKTFLDCDEWRGVWEGEAASAGWGCCVKDGDISEPNTDHGMGAETLVYTRTKCIKWNNHPNAHLMSEGHVAGTRWCSRYSLETICVRQQDGIETAKLCDNVPADFDSRHTYVNTDKVNGVDASAVRSDIHWWWSMSLPARRIAP